METAKADTTMESLHMVATLLLAIHRIITVRRMNHQIQMLTIRILMINSKTPGNTLSRSQCTMMPPKVITMSTFQVHTKEACITQASTRLIKISKCMIKTQMPKILITIQEMLNHQVEI